MNYFKRIVGLFLLIGLTVACSDTEDIALGTPDTITTPAEIRLGFGLDLERIGDDSMSVQANGIEHSYETSGYDVKITGNIPEDLHLINVDLSEEIIIQVTGSVTVTVKHPLFDDQKLSEEAYFSCKNVEVATAPGVGVVYAPLELVQGFVMVTTSDFILPFVDTVQIDGEAALMNTVYYKGGSNRMDVSVSVANRSVQGGHQNVIGKGVQYTLTFGDIISSGNKQAVSEQAIQNANLEMHTTQQSF